MRCYDVNTLAICRERGGASCERTQWGGETLKREGRGDAQGRGNCSAGGRGGVRALGRTSAGERGGAMRNTYRGV